MCRTAPPVSRRLALAGLAAGLTPLHSAGAAEATSAPPVRVGTWDREGNLLIGVSEALLTRLYADIGQPMVFVDLPTRRAGQLLAQGQLDANVHRASDFLSANPEVIAVPTPLNRVAMRAYTVQPALQAGAWKDLAPLRAAHLRGVLRVEQLMLPHQRRIESATSGGCWPLMWLMWCWSTRSPAPPPSAWLACPSCDAWSTSSTSTRCTTSCAPRSPGSPAGSTTRWRHRRPRAPSKPSGSPPWQA